MVKFLDLQAITMRHGDEIKAAIDRVVESGWFFSISIVERENRKGRQGNPKNSHVCRRIGRKLVARQIKRPK